MRKMDNLNLIHHRFGDEIFKNNTFYIWRQKKGNNDNDKWWWERRRRIDGWFYSCKTSTIRDSWFSIVVTIEEFMDLEITTIDKLVQTFASPWKTEIRISQTSFASKCLLKEKYETFDSHEIGCEQGSEEDPRKKLNSRL